MPTLIKSADGRRMWTIHDRGDRFECIGMRADPGEAPTIAGHHEFVTEAAAVAFCRSICGLKPMEDASCA